MKKIVQRTCIGCNLKKDKKELLRLVFNKAGQFFVDEKGKAEGRGTYICCDEQCLEKAIKTKRIEKTLGLKLNDELCNNIRGVIIERKKNKENN